MNIRREMAAGQLDQATKILGQWSIRLKNPDSIEQADGMGNVIGKIEVPYEESVINTLGLDTIKLRAELMAIAAMLEGMAST